MQSHVARVWKPWIKTKRYMQQCNVDISDGYVNGVHHSCRLPLPGALSYNEVRSVDNPNFGIAVLQLEVRVINRQLKLVNGVTYGCLQIRAHRPRGVLFLSLAADLHVAKIHLARSAALSYTWWSSFERCRIFKLPSAEGHHASGQASERASR